MGRRVHVVSRFGASRPCATSESMNCALRENEIHHLCQPLRKSNTYETSKFNIFCSKGLSSSLSSAKDARVPAARLYWIESKVWAAPSRVAMGSVWNCQNLSVRYSTSLGSNAEVKATPTSASACQSKGAGPSGLTVYFSNGFGSRIRKLRQLLDRELGCVDIV